VIDTQAAYAQNF